MNNSHSEYEIILSPQVQRTLRKAYRRERDRYEVICAALEALARDPTLAKPLKGSLKGFYAYRLGKFRILFTIPKQEKCLYVVKIAHRKEVYR